MAAGIGGGIAAAAVLLVVVLVVAVVVVSVCLRKRKNKHVNITDNVAYHCSNSSGQETMKLNEAYADLSGPSITTATNDAYGITGGASDVTTSQKRSCIKMKTLDTYRLLQARVTVLLILLIVVRILPYSPLSVCNVANHNVVIGHTM